MNVAMIFFYTVHLLCICKPIVIYFKSKMLGVQRQYSNKNVTVQILTVCPIHSLPGSAVTFTTGIYTT